MRHKGGQGGERRTGRGLSSRQRSIGLRKNMERAGSEAALLQFPVDGVISAQSPPLECLRGVRECEEASTPAVRTGEADRHDGAPEHQPPLIDNGTRHVSV